MTVGQDGGSVGHDGGSVGDDGKSVDHDGWSVGDDGNSIAKMFGYRFALFTAHYSVLIKRSMTNIKTINIYGHIYVRGNPDSFICGTFQERVTMSYGSVLSDTIKSVNSCTYRTVSK